jgi:hypothetical protein
VAWALALPAVQHLLHPLLPPWYCLLHPLVVLQLLLWWLVPRCHPGCLLMCLLWLPLQAYLSDMLLLLVMWMLLLVQAACMPP